MGSTTDPWRTAQARHRYRADERGQVHGTEETPTVAGLEHVSAQPSGRHRRYGSVRGADNLVPASVQSADPAACPTPDSVPTGHHTADRGTDYTAADRRLRMQAGSSRPCPRTRPILSRG